TEEFLDLPDDGVERMLIRGLVREVGSKAGGAAATQPPAHAFAVANACGVLGNWMSSRPKPCGRIYCGGVAFRLSQDPDTLVGVDVAYVDARVVADTPRKARFIGRAPVVAVEVLSPEDRQEGITDRLKAFLDAGTRQIWLLEPTFETLAVY